MVIAVKDNKQFTHRDNGVVPLHFNRTKFWKCENNKREDR